MRCNECLPHSTKWNKKHLTCLETKHVYEWKVCTSECDHTSSKTLNLYTTTLSQSVFMHFWRLLVYVSIDPVCVRQWPLIITEVRRKRSPLQKQNVYGWMKRPQPSLHATPPPRHSYNYYDTPTVRMWLSDVSPFVHCTRIIIRTLPQCVCDLLTSSIRPLYSHNYYDTPSVRMWPSGVSHSSTVLA